MKHAIEFHIQKKCERGARRWREFWDGPYTSEAKAWADFDEKYRNAGGERKQDFVVISIHINDIEFRETTSSKRTAA